MSLQHNIRAKLAHPKTPGYTTTLWSVPSTHLDKTQHLCIPWPLPQSRGYQWHSLTLLCTSWEHGRLAGPSPAVSLSLGSSTATSTAAPTSSLCSQKSPTPGCGWDSAQIPSLNPSRLVMKTPIKRRAAVLPPSARRLPWAAGEGAGKINTSSCARPPLLGGCSH